MDYVMSSPAIAELDTTQQTVAYAPFWKRALAFTIDRLIIMLPCVFIAALVEFGSLLPPPGRHGSMLWFKLALPLSWLYFTILDSSSLQGTVGKVALGLKITDLKGNRISFARANIRYFGHFLSWILC